MNTAIPSAEQVGELLRMLTLTQLKDVSARSGVPYRTLLNIRFAATPNPGIETVRKFFHHLPVVEKEKPEEQGVS